MQTDREDPWKSDILRGHSYRLVHSHHKSGLSRLSLSRFIKSDLFSTLKFGRIASVTSPLHPTWPRTLLLNAFSVGGGGGCDDVLGVSFGCVAVLFWSAGELRFQVVLRAPNCQTFSHHFLFSMLNFDLMLPIQFKLKECYVFHFWKYLFHFKLKWNLVKNIFN